MTKTASLEKPLILYAGNFGVAQGLPEILFAIRDYQKNSLLRWKFVGEGNMKEWALNFVDKHKLHHCISICEGVDVCEMPAIYNEASALLVSLVGDSGLTKTIPGRLLSMLASGRPVLGIIGGESKKLIEEWNCGLVADPEGSKSIEAMFDEFLQLSPDQFSEYGLNARKCYDSLFSSLSGRRFLGKALNGFV